MIVTLNIGLDRPTYLPWSPNVRYQWRLRYAQWAAVSLLSPQPIAGRQWRYTGDTLIAVGDLRLPLQRVDDVSSAINQDCIAVYFHRNGVGLLRGPHAMEWGEFDITKFTFF